MFIKYLVFRSMSYCSTPNYQSVPSVSVALYWKILLLEAVLDQELHLLQFSLVPIDNSQLKNVSFLRSGCSENLYIWRKLPCGKQDRNSEISFSIDTNIDKIHFHFGFWTFHSFVVLHTSSLFLN